MRNTWNSPQTQIKKTEEDSSLLQIVLFALAFMFLFTLAVRAQGGGATVFGSQLSVPGSQAQVVESASVSF